MAEESENPHVDLIDDDPTVLVALARFLRSAHITSRTFPSTEAFLRADEPAPNSVIVSDIWLTGRSGLDLPGSLTEKGWAIPVIFLTAHDTEENRTRAAETGAAYFRKPVDGEALLDAIGVAHGKTKVP